MLSEIVKTISVIMKVRVAKKEKVPWEMELRLKLVKQVLSMAAVIAALAVPIALLTNDEENGFRVGSLIVLACWFLYGAFGTYARYKTRIVIDARGIRLKRLRGIEFDLSWEEVEGYSPHNISGKLGPEDYRFEFLVLTKKDGHVITIMDQGWTPDLEIAAACMDTHMLARKTK